MKKSTIYWIVGGLAVAGLAVWAFSKNDEAPLSPTAPGQPSPSSPSGGGSGEILRLGSRGPNVRKLQEWLSLKSPEAATLIAASGGTDGIFGTETQRALVLVTGTNTFQI